jgi:hypothetical protein
LYSIACGRLKHGRIKGEEYPLTEHVMDAQLIDRRKSTMVSFEEKVRKYIISGFFTG